MTRADTERLYADAGLPYSPLESATLKRAWLGFEEVAAIFGHRRPEQLFADFATARIAQLRINAQAGAAVAQRGRAYGEVDELDTGEDDRTEAGF